MTTSAELEKTSKLLSYVLRHRPDAAGVTLGEGGWVAVDALLAGLAARGDVVSRDLLEAVVRSSDKQRFALSDDGSLIRANQGHSASTKVVLDLAPAAPPAVLYHGTKARSLEAIRTQGLRPMTRQHVHLSADTATAAQVGDRRDGATVVLRIDAAAMQRDGHAFWLSANQVWLTEAVPPAYITEGTASPA